MSDRRVAIFAALIGAAGAIAAAVITVMLPTCRGGRPAEPAPVRTTATTSRGNARAVMQPGLRVEFWNLPPFDREPRSPSGAAQTTRVDPQVDFRWGNDGPAAGIASDFFLARWSGEVHAPITGTYQFVLTHDDGARLTVNGVLIIDNWRRGGGHDRRGDVYLEGDRWYPIRLDFFEHTYRAEAQLRWRPPGGNLQLLGGEQVRSAAAQ